MMRHSAKTVQYKELLPNQIKPIILRAVRPLRNQFRLLNWRARTIPYHVNLNYWQEALNLGDALSPVIVSHMLSKKGLSLSMRTEKTYHLYAVGSVLTAGMQDAVVWGSGVLNASITERLRHRQLDIRAVRGPLTRCVLRDYGYQVPEVYGDPAIFLSDIYHPDVMIKKARYGLILHKDDQRQRAHADCLMISIQTNDYRRFVQQLLSVEMIISSSLHGIILAETYGIPAVLWAPQKDYLKYDDYYYSTGRLTYPVLNDWQELNTIQPPPLPDFTVMKAQLEKAFPYDLFGDAYGR